MGVGMTRKPRKSFDMTATAGRAGFGRGLMTNLLNPKVGVFYVSFLPQFVPAGVPAAPWMFGLAALHAFMSIFWFAALVGATVPLSGLLKHSGVVTWLDRVTGGVLIGFGVKLALARR